MSGIPWGIVAFRPALTRRVFRGLLGIQGGGVEGSPKGDYANGVSTEPMWNRPEGGLKFRRPGRTWLPLLFELGVSGI